MITHFVENLARGGLERVVIDLVRAQRDAGEQCQVICLFELGPLADELSALGVPVHACGKRDGADLGVLARARKLLQQVRGGVLHTHNAAAHYHAVAASLGLGLSRIINTRHGMGASDPRNRREWLYRRSMGRTDMVVAVCESARRQFEQQGVRPRGQLLSIPNGIRMERFAVATESSRGALVAELGFAPGTRLIGSVGRLNWAKDQASLIQAIRLLDDTMPDTALVLVGEGSLRSELEGEARRQGIAERVRFLGDRSDVERLLRGFSLFALSSVTEGYSVALLEACASALPMVATDVGGNAEIVQHGVNGLLVPAADPAALANGMRVVLQDPARAAAMGCAGRSWALAEGSFRTMAQRYFRLYRGDHLQQPQAGATAVVP